MKSNCVMCGDRFLCGATNQRLKLTLYGNRETDSIKAHCLKRTTRISENIRISGIKTEEEGRHQSIVPYVENIIKKRKGTMQSRWEKGFQLGEIKYFIEENKKSSKRSYTQLRKANMILPLRNFEEFKITLMPDRPVAEYERYVHGVMTQDPYHLSAKGNASQIYLFALHPDNDVLNAGKVVSKNIAATGGGGSMGGGSGGGLSSGAAVANAPMKKPSSGPRSKQATLNDNGEWVAKSAPTRAIASMPNYQSNRRQAKPQGDGMMGPTVDTYRMESKPKREASLKNTNIEIASGQSAPNLTNSNSNFKINRTKTKIPTHLESSDKEKVESEESNAGLFDLATESSSRSVSARRSKKSPDPKPSSVNPAGDPKGVEVTATAPVATVDYETASDKLMAAANQSIQNRIDNSMPNANTISARVSSVSKRQSGLKQMDGEIAQTQSTNGNNIFSSEESANLTTVWTCADIRDLVVTNYKNEFFCGITLERYSRCEKGFRKSILDKCEQLFGGKYPVEQDEFWSEENGGKLSSISRCAIHFAKMSEQYMPKTKTSQIPTSLITSFYEKEAVSELDMELTEIVSMSLELNPKTKYSDFYCLKSKKTSNAFKSQKEPALKLIALKIGANLSQIENRCEAYVDKYLPGILSKYRGSSLNQSTEKIQNNILYYSGLAYVNDGERKSHPSTLSGESRIKAGEEIYTQSKELYTDLKLYMKNYELKKFIHKNYDTEVGLIPVIDYKIEKGIGRRCPEAYRDEDSPKTQ